MDRYDSEVLHRFFEYYGGEEWMYEKYIPSKRHQRLQDRASEILSLHKKLSDYVLNGGILAPSEDDSAVKDAYARRIHDDIFPACVSVSLSSFTPRRVNNLPSSCTRAEFRALLPAEGVRCVYFSDPLVCPPPGLARFVWVTTDSVERAEQLCDVLRGEHEFGAGGEKKKMKLNVETETPMRRNAQLPFIANQPEKVAWDLDHLKQLCRILEHFWNVPSSFADTLEALARTAGTVGITDIDRVFVFVFFIRRVFGYDYWRGTQDEEFGVSLQVGVAAGISS